MAVETNFARVEKPNQDEKKNFPGDLVEPGDYNVEQLAGSKQRNTSLANHREVCSTVQGMMSKGSGSSKKMLKKRSKIELNL